MVRKPWREMCVLTEEGAAKLRLKLARERARYLEGADREARSRALALKSAKRAKKAKRKQQVQREAAVAAARARARRLVGASLRRGHQPLDGSDDQCNGTFDRSRKFNDSCVP